MIEYFEFFVEFLVEFVCADLLLKHNENIITKFGDKFGDKFGKFFFWGV